jgi:hypothetical protein
MSEKKTAEIKLRIEPSVKAQWQQSAADEGIGLSEWIGKACEQQRRFQNLVPTDVVEPVPGWSNLPLAPANDKICDDGYACLAPDCGCPDKPVPTSEAEKKFSEDWKPWS